MEHYRVNVVKRGANLFKHFDNEKKMFAWISEQIGEKVSSYAECEAWTRRQDVGIAHTNGYIEVLTIENLKDFYRNRRYYVTHLRKSEDLLFKYNHARTPFGRLKILTQYEIQHEIAKDFSNYYPQVWQGEI